MNYANIEWGTAAVGHTKKECRAKRQLGNLCCSSI
jgi:hypothetical protein